jgi:UDP-galactopyranose mutase
VNYPNTNEYTRITEFKHFLPTQKDSTTIAYEYPEEFIENKNERFYPIPQEKNRNLYEKYLVKAESLGNTFFVGRLAEYKYYNMNEIISVSLAIFETKIRNLF